MGSGVWPARAVVANVGFPWLTPRPDSELAVPWLTRNSKRRTTDARRSRLMEHAAAGLCKMLSSGHADFTLTLFDDSASLPEKQLKRQRSVNDRPVPPQSRLLYITLRHLCSGVHTADRAGVGRRSRKSRGRRAGFQAGH